VRGDERDFAASTVRRKQEIRSDEGSVVRRDQSDQSRRVRQSGQR
jgi:hypothetical protein